MSAGAAHFERQSSQKLCPHGSTRGLRELSDCFLPAAVSALLSAWPSGAYQSHAEQHHQFDTCTVRRDVHSAR